jgi:hypothetical protein
MDGGVMFAFTVEVRDKTLARVGQILPADLNFAASEPFNNVGTWTLTLAAGHPMVPVLRTPGAGIIVTRVDTNDVLISGPVDSPTVDMSASSPAGTVTIAGLSDTVILADRLAFPDPGTADATAQTAANDTRTDVAENLMHTYVGANIGPAAPSGRRDGRLTLGTNGHRGVTLTKGPRFQPLGALLNEIATVADYPSGTGRQLGFRVVQVGTSLEFRTYATADRSAAVRFDVDNGTLVSSKVSTAAPTVTRTIVAGQGDGVGRTIEVVTSSDSLAAESAWDRVIEAFIDQRQTDDTGQLIAAGTAALAQGGLAQFAMQITPADDMAWVYGVDYGLGDIVTVVVRDGGTDDLAATELSTTVTGFVLKADSSGARFGALLGQPSADQQADFSARLSNLERTGPTTTIAGLSDVDLSGTVPTSAALQYNASTGKWEAAARLDFEGVNSTADVLALAQAADTFKRWKVKGDGSVWWGSGSVAQDTNLYRSAADTLATDDSLTIAGNLTVSGNMLGAGAPFKRDVYTANATWTKPTGAKWVRVVAVGGGGGGGGGGAASSGASTHAGGGQAGSYSESYLAASTFSSSTTITIGTGGTGATTVATGGTGGTTTVGGTIVTAPGGIGGQGASTSSGVFGVQGGTGAAAGTGQVATAGAPGAYGFGGPQYGIGGAGGSSLYGSGGVGGQTATANQISAGSAATGRGAGGGGGACSGTTSSVAAGGAGSAGLVIIDTYF